MILRRWWRWWGESDERAAVARFTRIERMAAIFDRHGVSLLAFGVGSGEWRVVVEGEPSAVDRASLAFKIGFSRFDPGDGARRSSLGPATSVALASEADLEAAVAWAHRAPTEGGWRGPLGSPWSSHRDLLGYRVAPFYDAAVLAGRVRPERVDELAGGGGLIDRAALAVGQLTLDHWLAVAAAVRGVLPSDRRCFRRFVQLARARGWSVPVRAWALALTPRRVRQLLAEPEQWLTLAEQAMADPKMATGLYAEGSIR
jgi:hypothetical protein